MTKLLLQAARFELIYLEMERWIDGKMQSVICKPLQTLQAAEKTKGKEMQKYTA